MTTQKSIKLKMIFEENIPVESLNTLWDFYIEGAYHFAEGTGGGRWFVLNLDIPIDVGQNIVVNFQIPGGDFVHVEEPFEIFPNVRILVIPILTEFYWELKIFLTVGENSSLVSTAK